ncbi:MAG: YciC family protein [Bacteroidota bacterium]
MENTQSNEIINQSQLPEPTVSGSYGHGWVILKKYFPELLLVLLVQVLLSAPMGFTGIFFNVQYVGTFTTGLFNFIYGMLVLMPISYGSAWVYLKAVRGEPFRVQDMFFAYQSFGNILLANVLVFLIVGAGFIMLFVPGIIFACKLSFVPYLVMDEKMEAVDAVRKSWKMTKGHTGTIFLMGIVAFIVGLCGLICFVIGIIPAVIWISLAFAGIYMVVSGRAKEVKSVS